MNQRALIAAAAAITALVLVLFAVVIPGLSSQGVTPPAPTAAAAPTQVSPASTAQPQNVNAPTSAAQPQSTATSYAVSPEQAGTLALAAAGGGATLTGTPALVTYQGVVAYEVPLSTGFAYVDATSSAVLAAPGSTGTGSGSGTTSGEDGDDDDDDDDD